MCFAGLRATAFMWEEGRGQFASHLSYLFVEDSRDQLGWADLLESIFTHRVTHQLKSCLFLTNTAKHREVQMCP